MELISYGTCDLIGGDRTLLGKITGIDSPSVIASTLALLSGLGSFQPVESFISFISLQSSYAWYMKLSQFETVFLGLVMLEICFLRYLEVLPININNFFLGDPTGRRRRRKRSSLGKAKKFDCEGDIFTRSLFKVLQNLDDGKCLPLALCELESSRSNSNSASINRKLPRETFSLLNILKQFSHARANNNLKKEHQKDTDTNLPLSNEDGDNAGSTDITNCAVLDGLQVYEDAVLLGSSVAKSHYHNSTICEERYSACPLTKQDIQHYINLLIDTKLLSLL